MSYWLDKSVERRRRILMLVGAIVATMLVVGGVGYWCLVKPYGLNFRQDDGSSGRLSFPAESDMRATIPPLQSSLAANQRAVEFTLPDLFDRSHVYNLDDYAGHVVILNFWASWCVPCREEMPAFQRAYEAYRTEGFAVLGINETHIDDLTAARAFVNELELTFPSLRDDDGTVSDDLYRVLGLPTSVFITRGGTVAHVHIGVISEDLINTYSRQLLADEPISP